MADLYVDLEALTALAAQLEAVRAALADTKDSVNAYDARLGSKRIEEALDDFVSGWRDGRQQLTEGIEGLRVRLQGAAETYAEQEAALAAATGGP